MNETHISTPGFMSIGTTGDKQLVIVLAAPDRDGPCLSGIVSPALARIYAAMLMALADQMETPKAANK